MSADLNPDNATDPEDAHESTSMPETFVDVESLNRGRLRQIILIGLLGVMSAALVYDYRVARPSVEKAFDQIVKLNDQMNLSADPTPTLNTHIHKEIGRAPTKVKTKGPYRIEVFSWRAGLPFRTHDLYAVYVPNGNDLVFMRHYKFALPDNELDPPRPQTSGDDGENPAGAGGMPAPPIGMGMGMDGPGGPGDGDEGGGRPRRPRGEDEGGGRPQRPSSEGQDENPTADEGLPTTPDPEGTAPAADTPPSEPPAPSDDPTPSGDPVSSDLFPATPELSAPEPSTTLE